MNPFLKNNFKYIILICLLFSASYFFVFDAKVDVNGDNAGYYILAKSISTGQGYQNIHRPEVKPANHLPPGYPVIMSCIFKVLGTKITTVKLVNGFFFLLAVFVFFLLFRKISNTTHLAFVGSLLLIINAHFIRYATLMMSEIPFLLASSLCLYLFIKTDKSKAFYRNKFFFFYLILLAVSFYIRTAGIALLAGICFALLFEKRFQYLFATTIGFILLILPWQIRSHNLGGNSYLSQLIQKNPYRPEMGVMEVSDWFARFLANSKRYITREIPNSCLPYKLINYQSEITLWEWIIGIVLTLLIIRGVFLLKQHRNLIIGYLLGNFIILLLWPEIWYGVRFILPVTPFLLLLFLISLQHYINRFTSERFVQYIPYCLLLLFFIFCFPRLKINYLIAKAPYSPKYNNYLFIAKWARQNTNKDAIFCCRKDQLFYLFSKRKTVRYKNSLNNEEVITDLRNKQVDYVILEQLGFSSTQRYLYPAIKKYPHKFKTVHHQKKPDTYLLSFHPEKGYWGDWKDQKRNGKGKFTFPNGNTFIGNWSENLRNGKGIFIKQKDTIEGIWKNDTLITISKKRH